MGTCAGLRKRVRELEAAVFGLAAPEVEQIFGRIGREAHVPFGVDLASGKDRTAFMFVGPPVKPFYSARVAEAFLRGNAECTSQDKVDAGPVFASANAEDRFVRDAYVGSTADPAVADLERRLQQAMGRNADYLRQAREGEVRIAELEAATTEQLEVIGKLREQMADLVGGLPAAGPGPVYLPFGSYAGSPRVCVGDVVWYGGEERSVKRVGVGVVMTCSTHDVIAVPWSALVKHGLKRI